MHSSSATWCNDLLVSVVIVGRFLRESDRGVFKSQSGAAVVLLEASTT